MWLSPRIAGRELVVCRNRGSGVLNACDHVELRRLRFSRIVFARAISSAVPCASPEKPVRLYGVSYLITLSFGTPMLYRAAPSALSPPTITGFRCRDHNGREISKHDDSPTKGMAMNRPPRTIPKSAQNAPRVPELDPVAPVCKKPTTFSRCGIPCRRR